jgi:hypothetical protein
LLNNLWLVHPSGDALEEYTFRRLSEAETDALEEHLLTCVTCQEAFYQIDQFSAAIRAAAWQDFVRSERKTDSAEHTKDWQTPVSPIVQSNP